MKRWLIETFSSLQLRKTSLRDTRKLNSIRVQLDNLEERCNPIIGSLDDAMIVARGGGFDGVVQAGTGTGSLVYTGRHILTAAHITAADVTFQMTRAGTKYDISIPTPYRVNHPAYGVIENGCDISVLKLTDPEPNFSSSNRFLVAPYEANKFEFYTASDEDFHAFTMVGYGFPGKGETGRRTTDPINPKRIGENTFDAKCQTHL